jgi:hypothetical protein
MNNPNKGFPLKPLSFDLVFGKGFPVGKLITMTPLFFLPNRSRPCFSISGLI